MLAKFQKGEIKALCACDLLNEGWDCPETEVLFMARPTMSKVLYTQQLGRGMRLADGKKFLMVFDFVDNASQYNMPYSMHRLFRLKEYRPGQTVLGSKQQRAADAELYAKGEKPDALIDYPISATDFEAVDVFNWQEEAAGMISQMEFIPFDRKKFNPHITLLRKAQISRENPFRFSDVKVGHAELTVRSISLMRSDFGKRGAVYTEVGTITGHGL